MSTTRAAGAPAEAGTETSKPRLGFVGLGWIGRNRFDAVLASGAAEVVAVVDTDEDAMAAAADAAGCAVCSEIELLLEHDLDGVVIATPSALHRDQALRALEARVAVFCQKPLARTAREARAIVDAAQANDRLLAVDLSYRFVEAVRTVIDLAAGGELGPVHAIDMTFHNAYGPDKAWFLDPALAGGGAVIDLGTHLIDLALGALRWPRVEGVSSRLWRNGSLLPHPVDDLEDYAIAQIDLAGGTTLRLTCSWFLPAGQDAVIDIRVYGRKGRAAVANVDGSFYDFRAERFRGRRREVLADPPDDWSGRAILDWVGRLARGERFDPAAERYVVVSEVVDAIYGRTP